MQKLNSKLLQKVSTNKTSLKDSIFLLLAHLQYLQAFYFYFAIH